MGCPCQIEFDQAVRPLARNQLETGSEINTYESQLSSPKLPFVLTQHLVSQNIPREIDA